MADDAAVTIQQNKGGASRAVCQFCAYETPWVDTIPRAIALLDGHNAREHRD